MKLNFENKKCRNLQTLSVGNSNTLHDHPLDEVLNDAAFEMKTFLPKPGLHLETRICFFQKFHVFCDIPQDDHKAGNNPHPQTLEEAVEVLFLSAVETFS